MKIEELFGTLQQSMVETWRSHLKTSKYSEHIALDEYYSEIVGKVDTLIENWMGTHEKVEDYVNLLTDEEYESIAYLEALRDIVVEGRELMDSSELESNVDDILGLIDRTLYKLKELTENKVTSLSTYAKLTLEGKNLKEYISEEKARTNNGKEIAQEIIKAYFGGYEPKKLSDEGMKCETDEDMYKLIEKMELYYAHDVNSKDPYDESDIDTIHNTLTEWVKKHNK